MFSEFDTYFMRISTKVLEIKLEIIYSFQVLHFWLTKACLCYLTLRNQTRLLFGKLSCIHTRVDLESNNIKRKLTNLLKSRRKSTVVPLQRKRDVCS